MENLKAIKDRIETIGSIIKATNAMKMVASIKLSQVKAINKFSKNCCEKLFEMLSVIIGNLLYDQKLEKDHWLIAKPQGKQLVLILSADQGFCGSFNQLILDKAKETIKKYPSPLIKIFGKKAQNLSQDDLVKIQDRFDISKFSEEVCSIIVNLLQNEQLSKVLVVSSRSKNSMTQVAEVAQVFPFKVEENPKYVKIDGTSLELVGDLFTAYLKKLFTSLITEHLLSELSARTIAMDNSVKNAKDMVASLSALYNRSRQAKITKELTEIISSIECVQ